MKTKFNKVDNDWRLAKNHCRTTVNKKFTENEPSEEFITALLISEHSPVRVVHIDWSWDSIPYWVSTEWSRHKFEKFITSQRDDRNDNDIPRGKKPQDALVNFDGEANPQNLIDAWRKRLCFQATPDARELAEDFKIELRNIDKPLSDVLVPNCIYRGGCSEFNCCGYINAFRRWVANNYQEIDWFNIRERYNAYNEFFYSTHKKVDENNE